MTKKQQSKLKSLIFLKKYKDHDVFTGVGERNKVRKKNSHQQYTNYIWSTCFACNKKGDREESTKMMEEIFWSLKTVACVAQSVWQFQHANACSACASSFLIKQLLF